MRLKLTIGLAVALAMVGGGCRSPVLDRHLADAGTEPAASVTVDFGPVLLGTRAQRKVAVVNDGRGPFSVEAAEAGESADGAFGNDFAPPMTVGAGETKWITFTFEPTIERLHQSTVKLVLVDGPTPTLTVTLTGRGVKGQCVVSPGALDFGSVAIGASLVKQVKISNASDLDWQVDIGMSRGDVGAFTFSDFASGTYTVPAHGDVLVAIEFWPNRAGQHVGTLEIPSPAMCEPAVLPLSGNGFENALECEPKVEITDPNTGATRSVCRVDFGFVNPGKKASAQVTFRNVGSTDLTVRLPKGIEQSPGKGDPYALETPETTFIIPAGGQSVAIPLSFNPSVLGSQAGRFEFNSDDPKRPSGFVELMGIGGGPDIDVLPSRLDFGPVTLGAYQWRRLTIANVGTDVSGTTNDNLRLQREIDGTWQDARAEIVSDTPDEFALEWPPAGYDAGQGIAAGRSVELRVKFSPKTPGPKSATVRIYSNDPDEKVVDVVVSGGTMMPPPCSYEVIPGKLSFGTVELGTSRTLSFSIKTTSPDECLLSILGLSYGTSDAFTLVNGPLTNVRIKGGEALEIPVRFSPRQGSGPLDGAVEFYISSVAAPEGRVQVTGSAKGGCLMIAPGDLDFGTVAEACTSRQRTFTAYNICRSDVTLSSIYVEPGVSPEFKITGRPALPRTLNPGGQVEVRVAYAPRDVGEDTGSIALQTVQLAQPYLVTMAGRGVSKSIQTDVYYLDPLPRVDVLLVVDNSSSMADKQASLAANFASFIQFMLNQRVDYHIAVTTTGIDTAHGGVTDNPAPDENGRFVPLIGSTPRVITSSTPNAQAVFAQNVNVGTSGNSTAFLVRPAYLALTNPNLTGHNAGFLRDDAPLAVLVVSDAADMDATQLAFYENFFLNLKRGRSSMVAFSAIIPTLPSAPSGCSYDQPNAGQSTHVRDLVARTGGVYDDICAPNWAKTLERLGTPAFGYRTRFFLSNVPDMSVTPDPIQVRVDGQLYPAVGPLGDTRWTYNSTVNSIDFEPQGMPEPGSSLDVSYGVACP